MLCSSSSSQEFLDPDAARALVAPPNRFDWVVDAIDSIAPKQHLVLAAYNAGVPVVSSMGAGEAVGMSTHMDSHAPCIVMLFIATLL